MLETGTDPHPMSTTPPPPLPWTDLVSSALPPLGLDRILGAGVTAAAIYLVSHQGAVSSLKENQISGIEDALLARHDVSTESLSRARRAAQAESGRNRSWRVFQILANELDDWRPERSLDRLALAALGPRLWGACLGIDERPLKMTPETDIPGFGSIASGNLVLRHMHSMHGPPGNTLPAIILHAGGGEIRFPDGTILPGGRLTLGMASWQMSSCRDSPVSEGTSDPLSHHQDLEIGRAHV